MANPARTIMANPRRVPSCGFSLDCAGEVANAEFVFHIGPIREGERAPNVPVGHSDSWLILGSIVDGCQDGRPPLFLHIAHFLQLANLGVLASLAISCTILGHRYAATGWVDASTGQFDPPRPETACPAARMLRAAFMSALS